ncbi:vacuolar protein sorting-associated protein 70 [Trichomonascus vanleenenianus]|uniref:putative zinc metalloprotease n=1 Tax=Trichomonascus vanleenenianus TaxID=2268995 RepID=UPI003ECA3212
MVAFVTFGLLFVLAFNLVFLPRTSVSRDWRRLHHFKMSFTDVERTYLRSVDPLSIRQWSKKYTSERHLAGENQDLVEWTNEKFKSYGLKSQITSYDVYLNKPVDHRVALLNSDGSVKYEAKLVEDKLPDDPTTNLPEDQLVPTFHGYSASGNATGRYIYVNYGRREDYDLLLRKGVDFTNKVVIARYNHNFRGLKVKFAQDLGAAAVLLYSDPGDDSASIYEGDKAYPEGPARNPSSVQRGSVQYLSYGPGDPTTPGYPSREGVERKDPTHFIPKIPSVPISYADAIPLLKQLNGKGIPASELGEGWVGGLDEFDYSTGPSDLEINVYNEQDYAIRPIYNVIAKIDGVLPDEAIVLGNHRDAWIVGGASDPNSGSAALVELARGLGELIKRGWRPLRTIYLASWDGEEYGLLGSTEWGEDKAQFIDKHVLAYLNVDGACSGTQFHASANPLLKEILRKVSARVSSPVEGYDSLFEYWNETSGARIGSLGSGSDYTVFQDHLGVPSVDMGFGGGSRAVYQYHSNYDSFHWMDTMLDVDWKIHAAATKIWGLLALTLSEVEVVQFKVREYGELIKDYVTDLEGLVEPDALKDLQKDLDDFIFAAEKYDAYTDKLLDEFTTDYPWYRFFHKLALLARVKIANAKLKTLDRLFLYKKGLENRPWFKHIVFAPGRYTGYAGQLLPGLTEAIEDTNDVGIIKWSNVIRTSVVAVKNLLS